MSQIALTLNGRVYRFGCGDGEKARLIELGQYLQTHAEKISETHGQIRDERVLVMAALMVADELWDARAEIARLKSEGESDGDGEFDDESPIDLSPISRRVSSTG